MKRLAYFPLIILVAGWLVSCVKTDSSASESSEKLKPGDQIGNFRILKGEEGKVTYGYDLVCNEMEGNIACKASVGLPVNVSTGIYDDTYSGKLEEVWSGFTYELWIEDRPVDLEAFGTAEITHPMVGVIRYWNVVITTSQEGEITVRDSGIADGNPFESTTTFAFLKK